VGGYQLTALGRLAGESGTQVASILRLATALRGTPGSSLSELALVTATQLTLELDDTYLPLNRRSTQKEPAFWPAQLGGRGVPPAILAALQSWPADQWTGTMRAKRAVGCLLWMSELPLDEIERTIIQFGGGFDAAGPLRGVLSRTLDLLPTTIRVAEIIHTGVDFSKRTESLLARLDLGLPATIVPLALRARSILTRGEYLALATRNIRDADAVARATDEVLLACLGGSSSKLDALRRALARPVITRIPPAPIPTYEGT
jgi:helicase